MNSYYVYILGNEMPVLYVGVTNDLKKRIYEHKQKFVDGFTKQYDITKLLYFEETGSVEEAIKREKQLKNWKRDWKLDLIRGVNPNFIDLYNTLF